MPDCASGVYQLVFSDEFNGSTLDTSVWEIQPWGQGSLEHWSTLEYNAIENAIVNEGICHITGRKETVERRAVNWKKDDEVLEDGLPNLRTYHYTSSNLWTKKQYYYGKYEIRCRLPESNGFWPSFWMYGGKRWNEIDIFDGYDGPDRTINAIGHDFDGDGKAEGCSQKHSGGEMTDWHTYTCYFDFDKISFWQDEKLLTSFNRISSIAGHPLQCGEQIGTGSYNFLKSFPLESMSIIISMGVIKSNGTKNSMDETTVFPSSFDIDYVRFWRRKPNTPSLSVYPNPAHKTLSLASDEQLTFVFLSDLSGRVIRTLEVESTSVYFNISGINPGIYLLTCRWNGTTRYHKVCIQ